MPNQDNYIGKITGKQNGIKERRGGRGGEETGVGPEKGRVYY